jgi:hypothetical protein
MIGALRFWLLLVGLISAIISFAFQIGMQGAGSGGIGVMLIACPVVICMVCVMQCAVLQANISDQASGELTQATKMGLGLALILVGPGMFLCLLPAMFLGFSSFGSSGYSNSSSYVDTNTSIDVGYIILDFIGIALGSAGACIVGVSQGLVLKQYVEAAAWRIWVRTSAFASVFILSLGAIFVVISGWEWLTSGPGIAITSCVFAGSTLTWCLRK